MTRATEHTARAPSPPSSGGEGWGEGSIRESFACGGAPDPDPLPAKSGERERRHRARLSLVVAFASLALAAPAFAQSPAASWPSAKPIRLIVPLPAGSSVDLVGRLIAQKLGPRLGQTIVVEDRPGASGAIATE